MGIKELFSSDLTQATGFLGWLSWSPYLFRKITSICKTAMASYQFLIHPPCVNILLYHSGICWMVHT